MKKSFVALLAFVCVAAVPAANPADTPNAAAPNTDQVIEQFRNDLQATAAHAIQLDRRLGLVGQVKISSQVPLIPSAAP